MMDRETERKINIREEKEKEMSSGLVTDASICISRKTKK